MKAALFFSLFFFVLGHEVSYSQASNDLNVNLAKLTPVSPDAASLGKYGDVPVGNYTGIPQIGIPVMEYGTGNLHSTVSLSYHAGGIKVEEPASWVGAGWSLNAGGTISRSVREISDDADNGYFSASMTVKFMMDNYDNPTYHDAIRDNIISAGAGLYDTEPDIYSYNFDNYSGKFFYNQETHEFYTIGKSNIKIAYDTGKNFTITADNGNIYHFNVKEITTQNTSQCDGNVSANSYASNISSWLLGKVENSTQTDSITFSYTNISYSFTTLKTTTKYILTSSIGNSDSHMPQFTDQHCTSDITIDGKKLATITSRSEHINFTLGGRCDLPGDSALSKIEQFNVSNSLVKRFVFLYGYIGDLDSPYDCSNETVALSRRLKLKTVTEDTIHSGVVIPKPPYSFEYINDGTGFPSRLSYAQDFWGYYNAATSNVDLVPPTIVPGSPPIFWPGANRFVNTTHAQDGVLGKITYPTGGSTEFTYENNDVSDSTAPTTFSWKEKMIEGDHNGGVQTSYEGSQFTIDYPANYLNGLNPDGGTYVDFHYGEIGCGYTNGEANSCAVLTLEKLVDSTWETAVGPITSEIAGRYIPNGTYKLKAVFSQSPPGYADFYFQMYWRDPDTLFTYAPKVGGLRIQKITDYDGIDHSKDKIKIFEYKNQDGSSSGKFASKWREGFTSDFSHKYYSGFNDIDGCTYLTCLRTFIKRSSTSQYPLINTQGSYVGYSRVTVYNGDSGKNGKTIYTYTNSPDMVIDDFPYPYTSLEWNRGDLTEEDDYKKVGSNYILIKKTADSIATYTYNFHSALGYKLGFNKGGCAYSGAPCIESDAAQYLADLSYPLAVDYETYGGWSWNANTQNKEYSQSDTSLSITTTTKYDYDTINYQPNRIEETKSNGEKLITYISYPDNYLSGYMPTWLAHLQENNNALLPVEKITTKKMANDSEYVISATLITYNSDRPFPAKIYSIDINQPVSLGSFTRSYNSSGILIMDSRYSEKFLFNQYDSYDNIVEQQKSGDMIHSYIWNYKSSLPVAEATNSPVHNIAATSFESDGTGGWGYSGSVTDVTAPTGSQCYDLNNGSVTCTGMDAGTYIVSYWSNHGYFDVNGTSPTKTGKTLNGWTYYEHEITISIFDISEIDIRGSYYIDEVRMYPKGSLMTTYTYNPLVGITSQCDANNHITYYEYDGLGRLVLIKDEDQRILKKIEYKYKATSQQ